MNKIDNLIDLYNMLVPQVKPLGEHYGLCTVYVEVNVQTFKSNKELKRSLNRWLSYIFIMLSDLTKKIKAYPLDEQIALLEQYDRIVNAARTLKMGRANLIDREYNHFNGYPEKFASRLINAALRYNLQLLRQIRKELK